MYEMVFDAKNTKSFHSPLFTMNSKATPVVVTLTNGVERI